jgi:amidase
MGEWWKRSACEQAEAIRTGQVSCVEVMTDVVARIRARNDELDAIVSDLGDDAIAAARDADRAVAAHEQLGPLHGVPVTIKENIDIAGQPTPNGLPAFADLVATEDSPVVRNLKRAGAIVVGRTNTPELSMRLTTWNPLHGRTVNPWDPDATPGGSSGGAAAAAATGFGALHHGNDIAGSLRMPSFACGVATVKSTQGRLPAYNSTAKAERGLLSSLMSSQGIIAREVRDVRVATRVMAQPDPRDPLHVPLPFDGVPLPRPIRVAVTTNAHGYPAHPAIAALVDRAAGHLADAGYDVVTVEPPPIIDAATAWLSAGLTDLKITLDPTVRAHGTEELQRVFDAYYTLGRILGIDDFVTTLAARTGLIRTWSLFLEEHLLVLTPYLLRATPDWNYDGEGEQQTHDFFRAAIYSFGVNYLGLPAGVVPVDLIEGRPAGVQLIGRRFREDVVLDGLEAIERATGVMTHRLWDRETAT